MNSRLEEFNDDYVVVPLFAKSTYGVINVVRGDMTDKEWNTWNRVRTAPEIKEIISRSRPSEIPGKVLALLEDRGIARCLTNTERPIM
jgi:hypothetical protein